MSYEIEFTPLALAFANAKSSTGAIEEIVRGEIAELEGLEDPGQLIFHVFEAGGQDFIAHGRGTGKGIVIDTCTYEEMDVAIKDGPLAGKKMMFPRGDSE
jgi:hypothetical protein